jgi:hypothetical protein
VLTYSPKYFGILVLRCGHARANSTDGTRFFKHQYDAFAQVEMTVHPILVCITCHQVLTNKQSPDARVNEDTSFDRCFVHATLAQTTQVLELEHMGTGIASKQAIVKRMLQG